MTEMEGGFGNRGTWEGWEDVVELSTEEKVKRCFCFGCGEAEGEDLVAALRRCGVQEVRAALGKGGFDLDAFDAR